MYLKYIIVTLFILSTFISCIKEKEVSIHGTLVNGLTEEPYQDTHVKISHYVTFTNICGVVDEDDVTDKDGTFSFNFVQNCSSELFISDDSFSSGFGPYKIRVTDIDSKKQWENGGIERLINRPNVPHEQGSNNVIAEVLPFVIINPYRESDSTKVVDKIIIPELDIIIDTIFENSGSSFNQLESFVTTLEREISISILYTDSTRQDTAILFDFLDSPFLSIPF